MRKSFYRAVPTLLACLVAYGVSAQQDHVVLTNGDTLRGVVKNAGAKKNAF
jgi:hypothetical protein